MSSGYDGSNWYVWRLSVRELPETFKTYFIEQGSNFALTVSESVQWYQLSQPAPLLSSQDFVVKEGGRLFVVINFREELAGDLLIIKLTNQ